MENDNIKLLTELSDKNSEFHAVFSLPIAITPNRNKKLYLARKKTIKSVKLRELIFFLHVCTLIHVTKKNVLLAVINRTIPFLKNPLPTRNIKSKKSLQLCSYLNFFCQFFKLYFSNK